MSVASTSAAALTAGKSVVETTLICASVAQALSTTTVCKHVKIRAAGQKVWLQMRTQQHAWALVMQHGELLAIAPLTHMLHALHIPNSRHSLRNRTHSSVLSGLWPSHPQARRLAETIVADGRGHAGCIATGCQQ